MCIIAFQYKSNPQYDLIVAANRDEFYERPTKAAHFWNTSPRIFAGQDEQLGGTWIGISENGRFAAITNYRDPQLNILKPVSRGKIATGFLLNNESASNYATYLRQIKDDVGPYNVLLYDGTNFLHYNNVINKVTKVEPGTHTLCNATLNTSWSKTEKLYEQFEATITNDHWTEDELFNILQNRTVAEDHELPSTGVPYEMEKALSPIFIQLPNYGTRSSTVIKLNKTGAKFTEQSFENGEPTIKQEQTISFLFKEIR